VYLTPGVPDRCVPLTGRYSVAAAKGITECLSVNLLLAASVRAPDLGTLTVLYQIITAMAANFSYRKRDKTLKGIAVVALY
jgi:hypothetical protein